MILSTITYIFISGLGIFGGINTINYCKNNSENGAMTSNESINMTIEDVEKLEIIDPSNNKFKIDNSLYNNRIYDIIENEEDEEEEEEEEKNNKNQENEENIFYRITKLPYFTYNHRPGTII